MTGRPTAARWWQARGDLAPDRLVLLVQELRRRCAASRRHALRWDGLERAGQPAQADVRAGCR